MSKPVLSASTAIFFGLMAQALAADPVALPCPREDVQKRVCKRTAYDPAPVASYVYVQPTCDETHDYDAAIGNAYDLAPWKVKSELCRLSKIIVQTGRFAYSWGYWENPETRSVSGTRPNSYVGIRADATSSSLKAVLDNNLADTFSRTSPSLSLIHTVANDSAALGLLAVLAHEIGHIKWHRDGIYASLACYYDVFVEGGWNQNSQLAGSVIRRWHPTFSEPDAGGPADKHASHLDVDAPDPHDKDLNPGQVKNLYTKGFVSAVAGISPEEDFVETYALQSVLSTAVPPVIQLQITGPGNTVDIPHASSQSKRNCVGPALVYFPP
jgi:hypothetical protein